MADKQLTLKQPCSTRQICFEGQTGLQAVPPRNLGSHPRISALRTAVDNSLPGVAFNTGSHGHSQSRPTS